uniref:RNA polymerase II elongation factor ELL n=1 Tax=Echinococcus granulosus TaxID=6210 RepID=A0A068W8X3_ECHGR|nr:RNA polymerase II elongation factor ELL [Echinococcus granulosus]
MPAKTVSESVYKLCKAKRDDIEIFSVKLTDSALRSLETVSLKQNLYIPGKQACVSYDLSISPLHQTSDGTVDVIQFLGLRAINLGKAVSKLTVQANADSFSTAKLRMAEAEDHRKSHSKPSFVSSVRRSCMRDSNLNPRSVPTPPGSRNPDSRISPSSVARSCSPSVANVYNSPAAANAEVGARSLRDRIIHLLAIQSYQRPELLLRLKRDGLTDEQKDEVDSILGKVGRSGRQGEYRLSTTFINLIEPNWPGYSPSERCAVASLKASCHAKLSTNSPSNVNRLSVEGSVASRVTPSSRQNSPLIAPPTTAAVASVEDFGRKPTRASAPSAPHALSKKIAALDLLASGLSLASVAAHHGITLTLLESWKNNEATLRLRYSQRRGCTMPQPTAAPLSSMQDVSKNATYCVFAASNSTNTSKPSVSKRARLSSDESGVHSCGSTSSVSGNCLSFQSVPSSTNSHSGTTAIPAALPLVPLLSNSLKDSSPLGLDKRSPSSRKRPFDALCSIGGDGGGAGGVGVASDDQSRRTGSLSLRPVDERPTGAQRHRPCDRGSETSSCGDSCSPLVEATPLSQFYARVPVIDPKSDKGQRLYPCNEEKTSDLSDEDYLFDSVSSKNAEIERLYPAISSASQAAAYREAFESLYPKYLRLYEHFRVAWDKVINLKERILALAGGPHVEQMTRLATELDEFLSCMRKPERRDDEVRLLVMTFKLQHLKQRLATFASQEDTSGTASFRSSDAQLRQPHDHNGFLRAGASD